MRGGGGCTGGINTEGEGGGDPESPCKVWEDKSEYILMLIPVRHQVHHNPLA